MDSMTMTADLALDEKVSVLGKCAIFSSLKDTSLERVAQMCEWRAYPKGAPVFVGGQYDGREVLFILEGEAALYTPGAVSGEMEMRSFAAGGIFGAPYALAGEEGEATRLTVSAHDDLFVAAMHADAFRSVLTRHPSAAVALLETLASDLFSRGAYGASGAVLDPEARVYAELVGLAAPDPAAEGGWRISEMPKHRQLADCAGVTETGAAAAIAKLIREGVAKRDYPGLEILDYDRFRSFSRS